jgi:ketosteroid isomerase-like protein
VLAAEFFALTAQECAAPAVEGSESPVNTTAAPGTTSAASSSDRSHHGRASATKEPAMRIPLSTSAVCVGIPVAVALAMAAGCAQGRATEDANGIASEVTGSWSKAFDTGDASALAALYADDARSFPTGRTPLAGRADIEAYWRGDIGEGNATTQLTMANARRDGDVLHLDGTYVVNAAKNIELASGQYQQVWRRAGDGWLIAREMWRMDPALVRGTQVSERLTTEWTRAYNAGDTKALAALYADEAVTSTVQEGNFTGRSAIEQFWAADFGDGKPASTLTVTDAYLSGDLAHLEGEYSVADKNVVTEGHYVQLWMRDGNAWRVHREMWLR